MKHLSPSSVLGTILLLIQCTTKGLSGSGSSSMASTLSSISVSALSGSRASLPCSISGGVLYTVLWYRMDHGEPFYTFDGRDSQQHWSEVPPRGFGARARFHTDTSPATLDIDSIQTIEAGLYRCRVDFKAAQTQNYRVNLTVIVLPGRPKIFQEKEARRLENLAEIGPYHEGTKLFLSCIVSGGYPSPSVYWTLNGSIVDSSFFPTYSLAVQNTLSVERLSRSWAGASLACHAENNNISRPVTTTVNLLLWVRPLSVEVWQPEHPMSSGKDYQIECRSYGSVPPATLTWWRGPKFLGIIQQKVSKDENSSSSIKRFTASHRDDGKNLTCRAENTNMENASIEASITLTVHYPPRVKLQLGANIDPAFVYNGNDVFFECKVEANPPIYKVEWYKNGGRVSGQVSSGVLVRNSELVLQKVGRNNTGNYTCVASNLEGDQQSNPLALNVHYRPVCNSASPQIVGVSVRSKNSIVCSVSSYPDPTGFRWDLNSSGVVTELKHKDKNRSGFTVERSTSTLIFIPRSRSDLGTLRCWATNQRGQMESPCVFNLVSAGLPRPPRDCQVLNETMDSLHVSCLPGWDGGLTQKFHLELRDGPSRNVIRNLTKTSKPVFTLNLLPPGRQLFIIIYSSNDKGRSNGSVKLESTTSKVAELQQESESVPVSVTPGVLGVLFGGVFTLVLLLVGLAAVLRRKYGVRRAKGVDQESRDISEYGCVRLDHDNDDANEFVNLNAYGDHVNTSGSLIVNTDVHDHDVHDVPVVRGPKYNREHRIAQFYPNKDISSSHIASTNIQPNIHANPIFQSFQQDDDI